MSKKPSNRSITLKEVAKQKRQIDKMKRYILDYDAENNRNTIIKYHTVFGENKIHDLLQETLLAMDTDKERGLGFFKDDEHFLMYVHFLIAVRFTNLDSQVPKDFEEQVDAMNAMIDTGLFQRIFTEVLPPEEVEKVLNKLAEFNALVEKIGEVAEGSKSIVNSVKNKDFLEVFDPKE